MATDDSTPVPEMIERGARVLCEARRGERCQRRGFEMSDQDCAVCDFAIQCHTQSIWFIQAMREPTEAMIMRGEAARDNMGDETISNRAITTIKVDRIFSNMIDAALGK